MNHVPEKQETPKALKSTLNHSIPKDDQRRQKRWAPRMKTGCTTCRVRRIKCDETKPVCIRCQKSKRVCERLHAPQTLPSVRLASDWHNHSKASSHPLYNPGFIPVEDLDLYDYLRSKTIKQITAGVIQEFWNVDFLRANLQSKALWHAGLALAAMYRHKDARDQHSSLNFYTSSLNHYNHAMIHVIRLGSMKNPSWVDKEILLVASMLFTCICILANDEGASIVHLINGIRLFYNWRFWDAAGNHDSRLFDHKTLTLFITYFELDFPDQNEWALLSEERYSKSPTLCSRNPSTSIDDLYGELLDIYHYSLSWSTRQSLSLGVSESAVNVLNREANIWETKVKVFKSSVYFHHSVTSALTILELLHTQMTIGFGAAGKRHDATFIMNHQLQYASLIDRAEHYMKTNSISHNGIVFTMSLREIFSSVAKLCYRGDIRRKSIALLRICPQRDGCWDNNLIASVLEHIMNMEEAGIDDPDNEGGCSCVRNLYICGEHSEQEFCRDVVFVGGFADITLQTRKAYKLKRPPYRARVQL